MKEHLVKNSIIFVVIMSIVLGFVTNDTLFKTKAIKAAGNPYPTYN